MSAVYAHEKSDNSVVPEKLPNNELGSAEVMEERELAKGNSEQPSASRTQSRTNVLSGLLAVRQAARRDRRVKFTSLLHHVTVELLRESFYTSSEMRPVVWMACRGESTSKTFS